MRHLRTIATVVFCLCGAMSFNASADDTAGPTLTEIRAQQVELRADVQAGAGVFEDMDRLKREQLAARQSQLLALIEGKELVQELDDEDQVEAFNLLEQINATVNNLEDQQMVCEYVRKTGSHRKVKECKTVAQRREEREAAQRNLQETLERNCAGPACS